jgi:dihydroxyacetone kinase
MTEQLGDQNHLHVTINDTDVVTPARRYGPAVGDKAMSSYESLVFRRDGERAREPTNAMDTTPQRKSRRRSECRDQPRRRVDDVDRIGDGDHGLNMKRRAGDPQRLDDLATLPLPDALKAAGQMLVMKVGGASGPLYGTLFMTLGKEMPIAPKQDDVTRALGAAIAAVKKIGRSDVGQKTMLDVLCPVHEELASDGPALLVRQHGANAA